MISGLDIQPHFGEGDLVSASVAILYSLGVRIQQQQQQHRHHLFRQALINGPNLPCMKSVSSTRPMLEDGPGAIFTMSPCV